jgi:hypothetical protein
VPEKDCYLFNVLNINKNVEYLDVHQASWHEYLLALQPDLVVPGEWIVLSVEPWLSFLVLQGCRKEQEE